MKKPNLLEFRPPMQKPDFLSVISVALGVISLGICAYAQTAPLDTVDASASSQNTTPSLAIANLSPDQMEFLDKQKAAMELVYLEFNEEQNDPGFVASGASITSYYIYFETNRFHDRTIRHDTARSTPSTHDVWFDGSELYGGDLNPKSAVPDFLVKYSVDDLTEPERTKKKWEIPYLEAASYYVPDRISELQQFSSIEPLVLHYLKQSASTRIQTEGDNIRVIVRVPDRHLVAMRQMDLEKYRKYLKTRPWSEEIINKEMDTIERLRALPPERTVSFLLSPRFGYGTVEREDSTVDGHLISRIHTEDWKHFDASDIWLPNRCIEYYYTDPFDRKDFSEQPISTDIMNLESAEFGRKDIKFTVDYNKPGGWVMDRTVAESRSQPDHQIIYAVNANGTQLRVASDNVLPEMSHRRRILWISICIIILATPLTIFCVQKIRKAR